MISNKITVDGKVGMRVFYVAHANEGCLKGVITNVSKNKFTVRWLYDDIGYSYRDQELKKVDIVDHPSWKRVFIYDTDAEFLALQLKYNVS